MCGIAGFSLSPNSKQNARELAHALLSQIESRGSHASGFAWADDEGNLGVYKQPKPGSQLSLAELPRKARTVILHTRYATQGPASDNRNNHPVISTDNQIALVHNGVISNDHLLREDLGITTEHGLVDSLVIPSLIAQQGLDGFKKMAGYAAVAWLDANDGQPDLHIARLKTSPTAYTWLFDGSFVFASTQQLLIVALNKIDAFYGGVFDITDGRKFTVTAGFIMENSAAPAMTYNSYAYGQYGRATAGGHGTKPDTQHRSGYLPPIPKTEYPDKVGPVGVPSENKSVVVMGSDEATAERVYEDLEAWRKRRDAEDNAIQKTAMKSLAQSHGPAMALGMQSDLEDDDEWDQLYEAMRKEQERWDTDSASCSTVASRYLAGEGYYVVDHEGDMTHYPTLDDLESRLKFLAGMTQTDYDLFQFGEKADKDTLNWTNHVMDLGSVDAKGLLTSWVEDMADMDDHESPATYNLGYIREGIGKLATLKGA